MLFKLLILIHIGGSHLKTHLVDFCTWENLHHQYQQYMYKSIYLSSGPSKIDNLQNQSKPVFIHESTCLFPQLFMFKSSEYHTSGSTLLSFFHVASFCDRDEIMLIHQCAVRYAWLIAFQYANYANIVSNTILFRIKTNNV